ncbi:MAG: hypothetical protein J5J04_17295 [Anaerolineae bacterium]|nr:hypothetical protein [Anaerolineae bacterium]
MSTMRDADMPLTDRIDAAIQRITTGQGHMRIPVEATDPDIVLGECKVRIDRLRAAVTALAERVRLDRDYWITSGFYGDQIAEYDAALRLADEAMGEREG